MTDDHRLYVARPGWTAQVNLGNFRLHSFHFNAAAGGYDRIAVGEIYLTNGAEHYDLNSALALGLVTRARPQLTEPRLPEPEPGATGYPLQPHEPG